MLKNFHCIRSQSFREGLFFRRIINVGTVKASISTNAAINNSLRRSQRDRRTTRATTSRGRPKGAWSPYENVNSSQRVSNINYRQEDQLANRKRSRFDQGHDAIKVLPERRRRSILKTGRAQPRSTEDDTIHATPQYDYSSKPAGNRATRRADQFGHTPKASPNQDVTPRKAFISRRIGPREEKSEVPGGRQSREIEETPTKDFFQRNDHMTRRSNVEPPLSIPYTTPASEFLYGTSVVVSALQASRRKFYKLYIYEGDNRTNQDQDTKMRELALERNVMAKRVRGEWLRVMDRMSGGRPHNGYILEASPLPKLPVIGLQGVEERSGPLHVILGHQSQEDQDINGRDTQIEYKAVIPRFPFILLLDGILDPGNLGAIIRTAFFLGVDAVAIANRSSAPLSPVALKASSGASECLPLLAINKPAKFLETSKANGWKVYAAVAPGPSKSKSRNWSSTSHLKFPTRDYPCILILGSEGEGLRWNIQKMADHDVGIEGQRNGQGGVDSLNVSVAAGLLCEAFLRKPENSEFVTHGFSDSLSPKNIRRMESEENNLF